jgi:SAM-dependent methyltransferase
MSEQSPDLAAQGFLAASPDALRYDGGIDDPDEVAGVMRAYMPAGVRILDVGCGTGSITTVANLGKGNEIVGVEPDPDRAALARSRGMDVECGLLDEAFLKRRGPFDVVMFADVLEHLPDPTVLLRLAISGLKPGGLILISVPNVAHWTVRAKLLFGRFDYADTGIMDATHVRWFYDRSIRALVESAGLEVLAMRQTAGADLPVYSRPPFKWLPDGIRRPLIKASMRLAPKLVGCQHVLKTRVAPGG